jgi:hypothetical protein
MRLQDRLSHLAHLAQNAMRNQQLPQPPEFYLQDQDEDDVEEDDDLDGPIVDDDDDDDEDDDDELDNTGLQGQDDPGNN